MSVTFKVLDPKESYTFSKYFDLPYTPEEILSDLGYSLERLELELPHWGGDIPFLSDLEHTLRRNTRIVAPLSETARRETFVSPLLLALCDHLNLRLNIEFSLRANDWLKGTLDYYIMNSGTPLLVIEAKQADLTKGFTQLATELIALHFKHTLGVPLYGAVTTGDLWKFGRLNPDTKIIVEDTTLYQAPRDLAALVSVLLGILTQPKNF
jgi:hypothetical protein